MRTRAWILVLPALALGTACEQAEQPGESLGTFLVRGDLIENSCGSAAIPAISPILFPVELRQLGELTTWQREGGPAIAGRPSDDGGFVFQFETLIAANDGQAPPPEDVDDYIRLAEENPTAGEAPTCTLRQTEAVTIEVSHDTDAGADSDEDGGTDAGTAPLSGFSGSNTVHIAPTNGADCEAARAENGGTYLVLPCDVEYVISAVRE